MSESINLDLAMLASKTNGEGYITIAGKSVPIKITDISHFGDTGLTKIKCDVVKPLKDITRDDVPSAYPYHLIYSARTNGKTVAAMQAISKYLGLGGYMPGIEKVIFNNPATIVIWSDCTKTVVKVQNGEPFDKEKGLAMAIAKRAMGNTGSYFNEIKKWTSKDE